MASSSTPRSPEELRDRVGRLHDRIRAAGGTDVTVVAVTKGFGADVVAMAVAAGLVDLGESYAQEMHVKVDELDARGVVVPRWHFIGRLQRNKVRVVAPRIHLWQSVDRAELAREIARRQPGASVLVQVNISGEAQKGGCAPSDAEALAAAATAAGLRVEGVMGVGPMGPPEAARPAFRALARLADQLGVAVRSMGMTGDLEVAIEEGSTMVRVGRELFGARPVPGDRSVGTPPGGPPGGPGIAGGPTSL